MGNFLLAFSPSRLLAFSPSRLLASPAIWDTPAAVIGDARSDEGNAPPTWRRRVPAATGVGHRPRG